MIAVGRRIHRIEYIGAARRRPDKLRRAGRHDIGLVVLVGRCEDIGYLVFRLARRAGDIDDGYPVVVFPVNPFDRGIGRNVLTALVLTRIDGTGTVIIFITGGRGENDLRTHRTKLLVIGFLLHAGAREEHKTSHQGERQCKILFHVILLL